MIRPCTHADLPALQPLTAAFLALAGFGCDWPRASGVLGGIISQGIILADFRDGQARGAIGGVVVPNMLTGQRLAQEMFWYVQPEAKGVGLRLLMRFERWARTDAGCTHLVMASLECSPETAAVEEIYRRRGFDRLETHFIKEFAA